MLNRKLLIHKILTSKHTIVLMLNSKFNDLTLSATVGCCHSHQNLTSKPTLCLDPLLWARPYNEITCRSSLDLEFISLYGLAQSNGSRRKMGLEVGMATIPPWLKELKRIVEILDILNTHIFYKQLDPNRDSWLLRFQQGITHDFYKLFGLCMV